MLKAMRTGMDVAEGILDILVAQVRGDFEGVCTTPGQVEPAAMPEDMGIQLEGEARPRANRVVGVLGGAAHRLRGLWYGVPEGITPHHAPIARSGVRRGSSGSAPASEWF